MQVHLPLAESPVRVRSGANGACSDEAFLEVCRANPNLHVERNSEGDIIVMPPAGGESGYRSLDAAAQLHVWARKDRRGKVFDANTGFRLPDGSLFSPDASWVSTAALRRLTPAQRKDF